MDKKDLKKANEINNEIVELKSINSCLKNKTGKYPYVTITYFGNVGPAIKQISDKLNSELVEVIKAKIADDIEKLNVELKEL